LSCDRELATARRTESHCVHPTRDDVSASLIISKAAADGCFWVIERLLREKNFWIVPVDANHNPKHFEHARFTTRR
ncbi:MAG TPA: hypothetical protein VN673_04075, partial [Clostridia bacterium]|nr:hypothetical protein [Clostridia bacterium]